MIEFFKMCRISCDDCHEANFEVFTYAESVDPPDGWLYVTTYGWGCSGYSNKLLCCPSCVNKQRRNDNRLKTDRSAVYLRPDKS